MDHMAYLHIGSLLAMLNCGALVWQVDHSLFFVSTCTICLGLSSTLISRVLALLQNNYVRHYPNINIGSHKMQPLSWGQNRGKHVVQVGVRVRVSGGLGGLRNTRIT